jgi:predicted  nucleic acid-binding Zn-ribbon protein
MTQKPGDLHQQTSFVHFLLQPLVTYGMSLGIAFKDLLKIQLLVDETSLDRACGSIDDKLRRHEEMILELQRLLRDVPSRKDLEALRDALRREFDDKLRSLEQSLIDRLGARIDHVERSLKNQSNANEITELTNRLKGVEDVSSKTSHGLGELKTQVYAIASAYGRVHAPVISFERDLEKQLNGSTILITNNFKTIFDTLAELQKELAKLQETEAAPVETRIETTTTIENKVDIDISDLNPRPAFAASWRDPPNLPEIVKFSNVKDAIEYIYELQPKLQGYLTALHERAAATVDDMTGLMDRDALEALLEKLRRAILDMDNELAELRKGLGRNLSRADVMAMIAEALSFGAPDLTDTAIGAVRCIACGRDNRQVAGALS